jgi:hypothetical protein
VRQADGVYSRLLRRLGLIANVHRIDHRAGASGDPGEMTGSLKKMLEANIEDRATRDRTPGPSPIPKPDNWVSARGKGGWGLFHRDPKRIVGVLRVTLLNRLNNSREWAELQPEAHVTICELSAIIEVFEIDIAGKPDVAPMQQPPKFHSVEPN